MRLSSRLVACVCAWLLCGCGDTGFSGSLPTPDAAQFEAEVYPVLLRDCGFQACHGDSQRFLFVMGPGRTRLSTAIKVDDPVNADEVRVSYERARSMLASSLGDLNKAPLLLKPLSAQVGGAGHKGVDSLGRNVYQYVSDPNYQVLVRWAHSTMATGVTQ